MIKPAISDLLKISTNPDGYSIRKFIKFASQEIPANSTVLDAGAGTCQYRFFFPHVNYESCDFHAIFEKEAISLHTFICSLESIPVSDNSYDAIICTQVLEHVEHPKKALSELYRILKPGGKLFMTVPLMWQVHDAPYHYFNFTKYGLESIIKNENFEILSLQERGGYFWVLAQQLKVFPDFCLKSPFSIRIIIYPIVILLTPLFKYLFPLLLFYIDFLDQSKEFTLGYSCICKK